MFFILPSSIYDSFLEKLQKIFKKFHFRHSAQNNAPFLDYTDKQRTRKTESRKQKAGQGERLVLLLTHEAFCNSNNPSVFANIVSAKIPYPPVGSFKNT